MLVGQPPKQRWQLVGGHSINGDFLRIGLATLIPCAGDSQQNHQHLQQRGTNGLNGQDLPFRHVETAENGDVTD